VPPKAEDFNAKTPSKPEGAKPPRLPFFLCAMALFQGLGKNRKLFNEEIRKAGKESFRSCFPAFLIQISAGTCPPRAETRPDHVAVMSAESPTRRLPEFPRIGKPRRCFFQALEKFTVRFSKPWKKTPQHFQALENCPPSRRVQAVRWPTRV
jgi:hypothetical protein